MPTFDELLEQVLTLLQRDGRVAYRVLKRRFALSDDDLEDLKADLIDAKRVAVDEEGKVLVWGGEGAKEETGKRRIGEKTRKTIIPTDARRATPDPRLSSTGGRTPAVDRDVL